MMGKDSHCLIVRVSEEKHPQSRRHMFWSPKPQELSEVTVSNTYHKCWEPLEFPELAFVS